MAKKQTIQPKRKLINQPSPLSFSQIFGAFLLAIGTLTLLIMVVIQWFSTQPGEKDNSALIAMGFFLIMLGIAFFFPDMLKSGKNDITSTMRVATYMIVSVFVFLVVKVGWNCTSMNNFTLDKTWAYLVGIALGSKALQSFSENGIFNSKDAGVASQPINTPLAASGDLSVPLHPQTNINTPPPNNAPNYITKTS
jgi:hypothetical protein